MDSRETDLVRFLTFIEKTVWKVLFGKQADNLAIVAANQANGQPHDVYCILDTDPVVSHFVCNPPEFKKLSSTAFVAGIVAGMLDSAEFPAEVTAFAKNSDDTRSREIVFEIHFKKHVLQRHEKMKS
eukprot:TRINITY_DN17083_c0_g1_i2.p2 TRINITY_DN17083_c0_g1~~TRINITY_DN17083_c0_g1_i2.p2  ORF type:complete len:127 (+),score=38.57 TRINITY_DN17083_c0_g1_i2:259-639(+)